MDHSTEVTKAAGTTLACPNLDVTYFQAIAQQVTLYSLRHQLTHKIATLTIKNNVLDE